MPQIHVAFDTYSISHQSNYSLDVVITCINVVTVGRIIFTKDSIPLPKNLKLAFGPELHYPLSRYMEIISTLREEKPLFLWFDSDTLFGGVTTEREAVGEEEGK